MANGDSLTELTPYDKRRIEPRLLIQQLFVRVVLVFVIIIPIPILRTCLLLNWPSATCLRPIWQSWRFFHHFLKTPIACQTWAIRLIALKLLYFLLHGLRNSDF